MAAWLMAVCFQGLNRQETSWLTQEMRDSGVVLDLSSLGSPVDKHSTGGIGDKTSLILAPLVAAAGVPVPMMAGRGLGHTGGTLDKLESLPGFNVRLSFDQFKKQIESIGTAIIGQTAEICPADRKLYALRDVTGTVDSMGLICASIMSKKLAEGISSLVLDVKWGTGAFMKTLADAEKLAVSLREIGLACGKKVTALITNMNEPLGRFVGNALEVQECLSILNNDKPPTEGKSWMDTVELTLNLAGHMIFLGGKAATAKDGYKRATELLQSGAAAKKFSEMCRAQGADLSGKIKRAAVVIDIASTQDGFMNYKDLEKMGLACIQLGAGRRFQTDPLDYLAGLEVLRAQSAKVRKGDVIFRAHMKDEKAWPVALKTLQQSFEISESQPQITPLIAKVIE